MKWLLPLLIAACGTLPTATPALPQSPPPLQAHVTFVTAAGDTLTPFIAVSVDSVHLRKADVPPIIVTVHDTAPPRPTVGIGPWSFPADSLGKDYNAVLLNGKTPYASLAAVRARKGTAVVYLARNFTRTTDSVLSVALTKQFLDSWPDISSYIKDGTVWGIMVSDDIGGKDIWGPDAPYFARIDSLALLVKTKWPTARTIVRAAPSLMKYKWRWVGWSWAQYGAQPRNGEVNDYRKKQMALADSLGLCLVFGLNDIDGGNGTSQIRNSPNLWEMTPLEVVSYGRALLPYTPLLLHWEYRPATEARLRGAFRELRDVANRTVAISCAH